MKQPGAEGFNGIGGTGGRGRGGSTCDERPQTTGPWNNQVLSLTSSAMAARIFSLVSLLTSLRPFTSSDHAWLSE